MGNYHNQDPFLFSYKHSYVLPSSSSSSSSTSSKPFYFAASSPPSPGVSDYSESSTNYPPSSATAVTLCAACETLQQRCSDNCVLAPYFPPGETHRFTILHKVFGAANIINFLQELPVNQRPDAVSSMVYEAQARMLDPVYGCVGAISSLQQQIHQLQTQLALAQAEVVNLRVRSLNQESLVSYIQ